MRIDNLFQFIVPLTFLAIWALTSLFNREAAPLPPRVNRPPGPPGPRPGMPAAPSRPVERRPEPVPRDPTMRWSTTESPASRRPMNRPDDEILIIESEPRRTSPAPAARPGGGTTRRNPRTRTAASPAPKRPEPSTHRALSAEFSQGMANQGSHPLSLGTLSMTQTPLASQDMPSIAKVVSEPTRPVPGRVMPLGYDMRVALSTPAKLQESFIMNELLQPPLALRGTRGRRP